MSPRFQTSPEQEQVLQIISDYQRQVIDLDEAAPRLREALKKLPDGINLSMSRSIRRLFAEAARLDGQAWPEYEPDPARYRDGGRQMLETLETDWAYLRPQLGLEESFSIDFHFGATNERTAREIADWLEQQGQLDMKVHSPDEADSDDWEIGASTPKRRWSQAEFDQWAAMIRNVPVAGEAALTGWSY